MQVILTCFQSGELFGPLTRNKPAALLPVLNLPILQHRIELCVSGGFKEILIAVVDHPVAVRGFVGDGSRWGANITVQTFKDPCGPAETIDRLRDKLTGPVMLLPVEQCLNMTIAEIKSYHDSHDGKVSRLLCSKETAVEPKAENGGPLVADQVFSEPVDTGILVADSPSAAEHPPEATVFDGAWRRIDSAHGLWAANMAALAGRFPVLTNKISSDRGDGIRIGHHTEVHVSSVIQGPVLVGDFAGIRSDVQVEPYSVIGESSILDQGAQVGSSLILNNTYIGSETSINNSVVEGNIVFNLRIGSWTQVPDPFLLADVGKKLVTPLTFSLLDKSVACLLLVLTSPIWSIKGLLRVAGGKTFFSRKRLFKWDIISGSDGIHEAIPFDQLYFENSGRFVSRLPGLMDVVKGRLDLVGVRPLEKFQDLSALDEWTKLRFEAPAGLFTPVDAEALHEVSEEEKIIAENVYTGQRSFRHNLKVLVMAVKNLIFVSGRGL